MEMPVTLHGKYYGTKEAAQTLQRTEGRIRQMVRSKEIAAVRISTNVWLIPAKEVTRILKEREKQGVA